MSDELPPLPEEYGMLHNLKVWCDSDMDSYAREAVRAAVERERAKEKDLRAAIAGLYEINSRREQEHQAELSKYQSFAAPNQGGDAMAGAFKAKAEPVALPDQVQAAVDEWAVQPTEHAAEEAQYKTWHEGYVAGCEETKQRLVQPTEQPLIKSQSDVIEPSNQITDNKAEPVACPEGPPWLSNDENSAWQCGWEAGYNAHPPTSEWNDVARAVIELFENGRWTPRQQGLWIPIIERIRGLKR